MTMLLRKHECCCTSATNFVFECFPLICEQNIDGEGNSDFGWRRLFGYHAGIIADKLRFFVRVEEDQVTQLLSHDFPNREFIWWDNHLDGEYEGGGQLWALRRHTGSLDTHPDKLFGNSDKDGLPDDPRLFRNATYPNGLLPPNNAFDEEGDVWLEVELFTNNPDRQYDPYSDEFANKPGRITNTHYDCYLEETLPTEFDAEFTLMDIADDSTCEGYGWEPGLFSSVPSELRPKVIRANHLFHHMWTMTFRNFQKFGAVDENGVAIYLEPGLYGGSGDLSEEPDRPENIYRWTRWIAHAEARSQLYAMQFALTFDWWHRDRSYSYLTFDFANPCPCGTPLADCASYPQDCTRVYTYREGQDYYPAKFYIGQRYLLNPTGGEFSLYAPAGNYSWWPPTEGAEYPNNIRVRTGGTTDMCNAPDIFCRNTWGLQTGTPYPSPLLNFEFDVSQYLVVGSPDSSADPLGLLLSSNPATQEGNFNGDVDHYTKEDADTTGQNERILGWPTKANFRKAIVANYSSDTNFPNSTCNFSPANPGFAINLGVQTELQAMKFPICDLLKDKVDVDAYTSRGPDEGPVICMDGLLRKNVERYFHTGIDMVELWSNCTSKGLLPQFDSPSGVSSFAKENGMFRVKHGSNHIHVNYDTSVPCTTGPCGTCGQSGCNSTDPCGCQPDETCGNEFVDFFQNLFINPEGCSPGNGYLSMRGLHALQLAPDVPEGIKG